MGQVGYQHTNHLTTEILNELRENQTEMLALITDFADQNHEIDLEYYENTDQVFVANAVTQMSMQAETLKVLVELQKQLQNLSKDVKSGSGQGKKPAKKTPDNPPYTRAVTDKYCWTHGGSNHNSNECTRRATGHKSDATRANKLGGSQAFCN